MNVIVDGLLTSYARSGSGPVVLLLHGWGSDSRTFAETIRFLQSKYDCIAVDLPGFGGTQPPPKAWDLTDFSAFTAHFLEKLGVGQVYAVIGHSNGGALAIHAAGSGTLAAERLVLLGSAGIRNKRSTRKLALKFVAKAGKVVTRPLPRAHRGKLRAKLYSAAGSDMLVVPHMQATFQKTVGQDVQQDASRVKAKVLLINGSTDDATPPADAAKLARLMPDATAEVMEGAGHFVHVERSSQVNNRIREFLR